MSQEIKITDLFKETSKFNLTYRKNRLNGNPEFVLQSKNNGKHFASHTRFNLLDDAGNVIGNELITLDVAKFIIDNFESRGDTASFEIYQSDLSAGQLLKRQEVRVAPADVRHQLTRSENSFTATGEKLSHHWPIFKKYADTGYGSIIRATMTLHQLCSSHCHYCSTIARNKKDSISLQEAKDFVTALFDDQAKFNQEKFPEYNEQYKKVTGSDIRLKGLILSGGGQPNLWPHFEEFVDWLSDKDIDLGLITNGFPKKVSEEIYTKFKWIRISITPEDASPHYVNQQFNLQYLPKTIINNDQVTVGYSYVYGPWTDDDILGRINISIKDNGFQYCRLLTDCNLTRNAQLRAHQALAERLFRLGYIDDEGNPNAKIFHQLKYHGEVGEANQLWDQGQCFLQTYNVFWDTTGHEENGVSYCYACDSITVLAEEQSDSTVAVSERRFEHSKWGLVTNDQIAALYKNPVKPYFDPRQVCSACLFMKNNQTVKDLVATKDYENIRLGDVQHINFP